MKTAASKVSTKPEAKVAESSRSRSGSTRNMSSSNVVKRAGKSKVRAVPDFSKLHQKWEKQLQQGKACAKKPCTKVEEFHLSTPGQTTECPPNVLNEVQQENSTPSFKPDSEALKSITSGKGLAKTPSSRATVTGASRRIATSELPAASKNIPSSNKETETPAKTLSDVNKKDSGEVKFEADPNALQSILENQGLTNGPQGVLTARQTLAAPQRVPIRPNLPRPTDVVRRSTYYTGPATSSNRRQFYTEFTQRVVSRVAQSGAVGESPQAKFVKPAAVSTDPSTPVVTREKGSFYCKVKFDRLDSKRETLPATSSLQTATPKTTSKASRVLVGKTPVRTPGTVTKASRVMKDNVPESHVKQANPKIDKLVTKLQFEDNTDSKIQALEEAERKLEAEIAARESRPAVPEPSPESDSHSSSSDSVPSEQKKSTRVPFGILSSAEIERRSDPAFNPVNKSAKESSTANPCLKTPPKKVPNHYRYRDLPPSPSYRSPKFQRPQSPLVTSEKKARRKLPSVDPDATMDILTVPAMDKSKLDISSLNDSSASLGKSPSRMSLEYQVRHVAAALENSPFRESSPLKMVRDKENVAPKSPMGLEKVDLEKYKVEAALLALCSPRSKENMQRLSLCSPSKRLRDEKSSPPTSPDKSRRRKLSPKNLTNTEAFKKEEKRKVHFEKKGEKTRHDTTMQDLSQELNETKMEIDNLNQKALAYVSGSGSKEEENLLLKQMREIRERQEQLLALQLQLQSNLQKQSPSPTRVPTSSMTANYSPRPSPFPTLHTPSTPSESNQSYADFIAAHVEDISPYVTENSASRMPFELCVGAERAGRRAPEAAGRNSDGGNQSIPFQVAQSVLDESPRYERSLPCHMAWSPAMHSPKPVMAGLHQLMTASPAPIQTPLALRTMAGRVQPQRDLLEISSTDCSMLDTSKLFPTPEFPANTPVQSRPVARTPVGSPSGQVSSNSLMTTTLSFASPRFSPSQKASKGSLSLAANLSPRLHTSSIVQASSPQQASATHSPRPLTPLSERRGGSNVGLRQSTIFSQAVARFHDALLDEEVELYACRVADKQPCVQDARIVNPVALTLTGGDDMHFIPVEGAIQTLPSHEGSAFSAPNLK